MRMVEHISVFQPIHRIRVDSPNDTKTLRRVGANGETSCIFKRKLNVMVVMLISRAVRHRVGVSLMFLC